jgi:hypothetical protein
MILSLAVILLPILLVSWFFTRTPGAPPTPAIDWAPTLAVARSESPYPVLAPTALPGSWIPRKVVWAKPGRPGLDGRPAPGNTWQLGLLSPEKTYITITQRDADQSQLVADLSRNGAVDGTVTAGGRTWIRQVSPDGRTRALVATNGPVVAVVAGDTSYDALVAFATTLADR